MFRECYLYNLVLFEEDRETNKEVCEQRLSQNNALSQPYIFNDGPVVKAAAAVNLTQHGQHSVAGYTRSAIDYTQQRALNDASSSPFHASQEVPRSPKYYNESPAIDSKLMITFMLKRLSAPRVCL